MTPLNKIALVLAAHCLAVPLHAAGLQAERALAASAAEDNVQAALFTLERQRANAILRRDTAALRNLMDRQYQHVDSRGRMRSKTELLMTLERDQFRFRVYELESAEIQLLDGGGAALVTGVFRSVQANAPSRVFRGRYARIWVRQPDGWRNTFHQSTEIRPVQ